MRLEPRRRARRVLGEQRPVVADAWLLTVEALGRAVASDRRGADRALAESRAAAAIALIWPSSAVRAILTS
ncbi:hypothetical protein [Streptomyces sp. SudanB182_2057]|uniref:hypothetical protein n=1 Tax=Streptomyces sp. SudanB182_2057 TaxID=3035281 RepID=UPI003F57ADCB